MALLCLAHGSRDPRHAATMDALVSGVRRERPGLRVELAYLDHCTPSASPAVASLAAAGHRSVVVAPLLLTRAYHGTVDVPTVLRSAAARTPEVSLRAAPVLGPSSLLVAALERRLAEAGVVAGDPRTAVVLASAGCSDPRARTEVERLAARWARRGWAAVVPAYASAAAPTVEQAVRTAREAGATRVAVASYFLAPGFLTHRVRAGAELADVVTSELADSPELVRLVLQRYDAVRTRPLAA